VSALARDPRRVARAAADLDGRDAAGILAWAVEHVPRLAVTSSFGADSAVLLHLVSRVAPDVPVLFLDTGLHPEATLAHRDELTRRLGLHVVDLSPDLSVDEQALRHGEELWRRDPDACCAMRKTVPLRRALGGFDGWASGVRRDQTAERAGTPVVEVRVQDGRSLLKVAPLATWRAGDVARYLDEHDLPRHPLVADGFPSIGCAPCTTAVAPGADPRSGRWAAFDDKVECGIHLDEDGRVQRARLPLVPAVREV
jgi:phosphoadenosine phosphosulfate reductase